MLISQAEKVFVFDIDIDGNNRLSDQDVYVIQDFMKVWRLKVTKYRKV